MYSKQYNNMHILEALMLIMALATPATHLAVFMPIIWVVGRQIALSMHLALARAQPRGCATREALANKKLWQFHVIHLRQGIGRTVGRTVGVIIIEQLSCRRVAY